MEALAYARESLVDLDDDWDDRAADAIRDLVSCAVREAIDDHPRVLAAEFDRLVLATRLGERRR
jgi:hypothetical protein